MSTMFLRSLLTVGALAAIFAAPAQAAPELTSPLNPCYLVAQESQRQPVKVAAKGFTPLSLVKIYIDDILQIDTKALVDGTINGQVLAPFQEEGTGSFRLRVSEVDAPANTLEATTLVTRLAVEQSPRRASTTQKVRFKGRGFMEPGLPVYAHYVFAAKARKSVRLGLPKGPCGTFNFKRPQFPFKKSPGEGKWTIQFDQNPRYDPKTAVRVPMTIRVKKTPKREQARPR
jgi:hypothetical protein